MNVGDSRECQIFLIVENKTPFLTSKSIEVKENLVVLIFTRILNEESFNKESFTKPEQYLKDPVLADQVINQIRVKSFTRNYPYERLYKRKPLPPSLLSNEGESLKRNPSYPTQGS